MNDVRTVAELEHTLRTAEPDVLQPADLGRIRALGRRRRRARQGLVAGGIAAAVVVASLGAGVAGLGGHDDAHVADTPGLTPLAQRALAEIPGAERVTGTQVVIPGPAEPDHVQPDDLLTSASLTAGPVDIGTRYYQGVTAFPRADFPAWLYDAVADHEAAQVEHNEGDALDSRPIGTTDLGVVVDGGPYRLACVTSRIPGDRCFPALVRGDDEAMVQEVGWAGDFLKPGGGTGLTHLPTYADGEPATVWVGGVDGTTVASVDLVTEDGTTVRADVAAGTLVPGDTMFWGTVSGNLAEVVTRDAEGNRIGTYAPDD